MFPKVTLALAGLLTMVTADALPSHIVVSVIDSTSGSTIGSLNGYGNFSSPGPDYPFHTIATTGDFATIHGYGPCVAAGGLFACRLGYTGTGDNFDEIDGNLVLQGTDGAWSVDNTTDAAGGLNQYGQKNGIPVYLGSFAAVPVTLSVAYTSG